MNRTVVTVLLCGVLALAPAVVHVDAASRTSVGGWQTLATLPFAVLCTAQAPGASSTILAATDGHGIYLIGSQGNVVQHLPSVLDGLHTTCMSFLSDKVVFAGTSERGLFRSVDAGQTWTHVDNLDCSNIAQIRVEADRSAVFVPSYCSGLHYSMDQGRSWAKLSRGISTFLTTDVVRMGTTTIAVSTLDKGVFVSSDNGQLFRPLTCPVQGVKKLAFDTAAGTLYAVAERSLAWSSDKGTTWHSVQTPAGVQITSIATAVGGRLILGTAGDGALVSTDRGKTLRSMSVGSSSVMINSLEVLDSTLVLGSHEGDIAVADLDAPFLNIDASDISLGTVASNKSGSAQVHVRNVGSGLLTVRVTGAPSYLTVSPATLTGNTATIGIAVKPSDLEHRSYQSNLRIETNGGTAFLTVRFTVGPAAPVVVGLVAGSKTCTVDGRKVTLDAASFIDKASGRMMVPFRFVVQAFGATVAWNGATRAVHVSLPASQARPAVSVTLIVGSSTAYINGQGRTLDVAPQIRNSLTFVPLRFISESLGAAVRWDPVKLQAIVTYIP